MLTIDPTGAVLADTMTISSIKFGRLTAQHSLPGGALPPYRGRSFTGRIASASPDAPEPEVRIHLPPAVSHVRT